MEDGPRSVSAALGPTHIYDRKWVTVTALWTGEDGEVRDATCRHDGGTNRCSRRPAELIGTRSISFRY